MVRVLSVLMLFASLQLWSQNSANETKFFYAHKYMYDGEDARAAALLDEILRSDSTYSRAYHLLAEILDAQEKFVELNDLYAKAARILGKEEPAFTMLHGNTLYKLGQVKEARAEFEKALAFPSLEQKYRKLSEKMLQKCKDSETIKNNPVPFSPVSMGNSINSKYDEYLPSFSVDQTVMFITRKLVTGTDPVTGKENTNEDFFSCTRLPDGNWSVAQPVSSLNTNDNEGAHCLSADGKSLVFTACNRMDSYGTCDLYYSGYNAGYWSTPKNMGPYINSIWWDSQPSMAADGKTVFFSSKRRGGKGGLDIWYSKLNAAGIWMEPVNLGDTINTSENEISPFIHPDGMTLYFASKGHPGVGNYDIFMSRKVNGKWMPPVNLGYPINTEKDEMSLIVNAAGNTAYYASVREGGMGGQDIYSFELPATVRAGNVTWIKGHVCDSLTGKNLEGKAELYHIQSGTLVHSGIASKDGTFLACFHQDGDFAVNVTHNGYLIYSDHFTVNGDFGKTPFIKEIPMRPIRKGASMNLNNIFFDTDKYVLKNESYFELGRLLSFLRANANVTVKIIGHTDNQGNAEHNRQLSKNRAEVVMKYLQDKGISVNRMSCEGKGADVPVAVNNTPEGRALNRRTEIIIIAIR